MARHPTCHLRVCLPGTLQSFGRTQARNATCPTYITAGAGCGPSLPIMAVAPTTTTKWTFEPVPGSNIYRWYIRMSVSHRHSACLHLLSAGAQWGARFFV